MNDRQYVLQMQGIVKNFSGVKALKGVDFSVYKGEVHALVGENGAGKSTLIKILTGVYPKDGGTIILDNEEVAVHSPFEAQKLGISPIYQELNLIPELTVAENIFLGYAPKKKGVIDWRQMERAAEEAVAAMGIDVDVRAKVSSLGAAHQQMVAIVRAIQFDCKLMVMDEPTSSLDKKEVEALMRVIRELKRKGIAVIFISHRLDELFEICDRATILKDGSLVGTYEMSELTQEDMVVKMVGHSIETRERHREAKERSDEEYIFEMSHVKWLPVIEDMSIKIRKGEVLGLAGLLGAGRTESAKVIFGYESPDSAEFRKLGKPVAITSTTDAIELGMGMCPEERRKEGIIPHMSVKDNLMLASLKKFSKMGFLSESDKQKYSEEYISKLAIKTPSPEQLIKNLSGGNQQKVILARWLITDPQMIILDEPTRGIDIGAKGAIEDIIQSLAAQGISILYISSEIDELVCNCDRVLVMREGRMVQELSNDEISRKNILKALAQTTAKKEGGADDEA